MRGTDLPLPGPRSRLWTERSLRGRCSSGGGLCSSYRCPYQQYVPVASERETQLTAPFAARLTEKEVTYLLDNSGASLVLVDTEFVNLVASSTVPVVSCDDSGLASDPYEQFLLEGAEFDRRHGDLGWGGLEFQKDELATFAISCTFLSSLARAARFGADACVADTSGTTSRPKGVESSYRGTYLAAIANAVESGLGAKSSYLWILPMVRTFCTRTSGYG